MSNRRKFLLSAGTIASLGISGIGSVSGLEREPTTEEINEAFCKGIAEDGSEGGREQLKDLGLDPLVSESQDFQTETDETTQQDESSTSLTPQYTYEDPDGGDSYLHTALFVSDSFDDNEVGVSVSMFLKGCNATARNSWWVDDVIGIGFIEKDWAPMGNPSVYVDDPHSAKFTAENVDDDALAGTIDTYRSSSDARCDTVPPSMAGLTGKFRLRDGGEPTTLWGSYTHNFSGTPSGAIESISGGRNGISVTLSPAASTVWSIADSNDPEDTSNF